MKIFSLQSKTSLVGWSLILGLVTNFLISKFSFISFCTKVNPHLNRYCPISWGAYGFPFKIETGLLEGSLEVTLKTQILPILNYVFWILIILIVLGLIRHFRNKKA